MQALGFLAQAYYKSDELENAELNFKKRWILPKRWIASRKRLKFK
jgi:hypothetical protein